MDFIIREYMSTLLPLTENILSKLQAGYPAFFRLWSCVYLIFYAMQSDHVAHSGKVMINDRVLSAISAQTSLCIFMKTKWNVIFYILSSHLKKKICKFLQKKWHREDKLLHQLFINSHWNACRSLPFSPMHRPSFVPILLVELYTSLILPTEMTTYSRSL